MDYVKPADFIESLVGTGAAKARLPLRDLLVRGFLSGALLGFATALAMLATVQSGLGLVGAIVFPVGLVMIVLLGLELVTGNFALVPLAVKEGRVTPAQMMASFGWVFLANLVGSMFFGALLYVALTMAGHTTDTTGLAAKIVTVARAKTLGYEHFGAAGLFTAFTKGILCNWMVTLGVVISFTSRSTIGKIAAIWMPIFVFFFLGMEHSVVNMFIIPTGILLGAKVSLAQWWIWNEIPVTLGNFVGRFLFTGLALYLTYRAPAMHTEGVVLPVAATPVAA